MAEQQDFACPSCAAPLRATGYETQVRCEYCGTTVIVPQELRHPPPPVYPPPPPPIYPPAYYAPPPPIPARPNSTANTAMILGLIGLPLSCFFVPVGLPFSIGALLLVWAYNNHLRRYPQTATHPADEGRIRVAQITGLAGLVLFLCTCGSVLGLNVLAPALGIAVPTPGLTPLP